ncbi:hypothetical protein X801_09429 [Opisthorchis viverrini]|uniref:GOST seven transmembrane domain-containing protein n=1 Tax=Opisthorchis viverrini TaxID=6198 RepID=A0A1S8WK15_OPIVI|nr:hypothetical protein X801_09429 [Opisthorchis viverrini]
MAVTTVYSSKNRRKDDSTILEAFLPEIFSGTSLYMCNNISWHLLWIDDAFWQFLFVVILTFIVVLWRPTGSNRQYAYSLLDIAIDEEVDEEDEDVLLDRLDQDGTELTKIRSRQLGESDDDAGDGKASVQSRNDELSPLHYAQGPIPATIVERVKVHCGFVWLESLHKDANFLSSPFPYQFVFAPHRM